MTLSAGSRLGGYDVVSLLGAGGMGEVYRARDTRLGREVAIKVLPEALAHDRERLARFRREAQVLAALNHPRIAAIHGLEEVNGTPFLVLELVPGEDLAATLVRGPLPLDEALEVARQIAEGLEAAHESGVVHRDLKPANVKRTPDGSVKLLDFGLAKAFTDESPARSGPDLSHSPTLTSPSTGLGVLLGTAAYMAPEQARGRPVDRRADVWALGVVLYEMLTGTRLFTGETVTDVLAAVLTRDVDLWKLPERTPPRIRELVRRCLVRDPKQRLHDAGDARLELEEALRELASGVAPGSGAASVRPRSWALLALPALLAGIGIGRALLPEAKAPAFRGPLRAVVPLPEGVRLSGWSSPTLALSDDGRYLAFVGEKAGALRQLFVHDLARGETRVAPASETAEGPFFSRDGESIAFATSVSQARMAEGPLLKRFSFRTGLTEPLCAIEDYFGGDWRDDGSIYFVNDQPRGLFVLRPGARSAETTAGAFRSGGKERKRQVNWPQLLPDGRSALLVDTRGRGGNAWASVLDLASRELDDLGIETGFARYAASGHLLTVRKDGTLMATPFDPKARKVRGPSSAVLGGVAFSCNEAAVLAVSPSGTLAYATGYIGGSNRELLRVVRISADGRLRPLPLEPQELFGRLALTADGERAAIVAWDGTLWVWDLARGTRRPLPGVASVESIALSADGRTIACAGSTADEGARYEMHVVSADGTAPPRTLPGVSAGGEEMRAGSFTPDGRTIVGTLLNAGHWGVWAWPASGSSAPTRIEIGEKIIVEPKVSPDGRLLAYQSSDTGRSEIYVRTIDGSGLVPVSSAGGLMPRWARDGSELYFRQGDALMAVHVSRSPDGAASAGTAEKIAALPEVFAFEPTSRRREFIALQRVPGSGVVTEIHLVLGFLDELRRESRPQ